MVGQAVHLSQALLQALHVAHLPHVHARQSLPRKHGEVQHLRETGNPTSNGNEA